MKYSLTFTNENKVEIVKEFQAITKRNGFKQNALVFEYMNYIVSRLKEYEGTKEDPLDKLTQMDVYFNKSRIELEFSNEK